MVSSSYTSRVRSLYNVKLSYYYLVTNYFKPQVLLVGVWYVLYFYASLIRSELDWTAVGPFG